MAAVSRIDPGGACYSPLYFAHCLGKPLTGLLAGIHPYSITFPGAQYRIAYRIIETDQVIFVLMAGKRKQFYDRLRRRITLP